MAFNGEKGRSLVENSSEGEAHYRYDGLRQHGERSGGKGERCMLSKEEVFDRRAAPDSQPDQRDDRGDRDDVGEFEEAHFQKAQRAEQARQKARQRLLLWRLGRTGCCLQILSREAVCACKACQGATRQLETDGVDEGMHKW